MADALAFARRHRAALSVAAALAMLALGVAAVEALTRELSSPRCAGRSTRSRRTASPPRWR
ncbi:hypothetical protein AB5I41_26695 [Sphingomonas sp. MMS24-JH45]